MNEHEEAGSALEFSGEILVPTMNFAAYREIYEVECWVRRICLAAWMGTFGRDWLNNVDSQLRQTLERRAVRNRDRLYLGTENDSEIVWQATHGELLRLLTATGVAPLVEELTGSRPEFLQLKLDEIREIRNVLAHNRALASRTRTILKGLLASLEDCVTNFKRNVLYADGEIMIGNDSDLSQRLEGQWRHKLGRMRGFVGTHGDRLLEYVVWADFDGERQWVDAEALLRQYQSVQSLVVAFLINKQGGEYQVLTPTCLSEDDQHKVCDTVGSYPPVWSTSEYREQDPRHVCSPKIWFYENRSPHYRNPQYQ